MSKVNVKTKVKSPKYVEHEEKGNKVIQPSRIMRQAILDFNKQIEIGNKVRHIIERKHDFHLIKLPDCCSSCKHGSTPYGTLMADRCFAYESKYGSWGRVNAFGICDMFIRKKGKKK